MLETTPRQQRRVAWWRSITIGDDEVVVLGVADNARDGRRRSRGVGVVDDGVVERSETAGKGETTELRRGAAWSG